MTSRVLLHKRVLYCCATTSGLEFREGWFVRGQLKTSKPIYSLAFKLAAPKIVQAWPCGCEKLGIFVLFSLQSSAFDQLAIAP